MQSLLEYVRANAAPLDVLAGATREASLGVTSLRAALHPLHLLQIFSRVLYLLGDPFADFTSSDVLGLCRAIACARDRRSFLDPHFSATTAADKSSDAVLEGVYLSLCKRLGLRCLFQDGHLFAVSFDGEGDLPVGNEREAGWLSLGRSLATLCELKELEEAFLAVTPRIGPASPPPGSPLAVGSCRYCDWLNASVVSGANSNSSSVGGSGSGDGGGEAAAAAGGGCSHQRLPVLTPREHLAFFSGHLPSSIANDSNSLERLWSYLCQYDGLDEGVARFLPLHSTRHLALKSYQQLHAFKMDFLLTTSSSYSSSSSASSHSPQKAADSALALLHLFSTPAAAFSCGGGVISRRKLLRGLIRAGVPNTIRAQLWLRPETSGIACASLDSIRWGGVEALAASKQEDKKTGEETAAAGPAKAKAKLPGLSEALKAALKEADLSSCGVGSSAMMTISDYLLLLSMNAPALMETGSLPDQLAGLATVFLQEAKRMAPAAEASPSSPGAGTSSGAAAVAATSHRISLVVVSGAADDDEGDDSGEQQEATRWISAPASTVKQLERDLPRTLPHLPASNPLLPVAEMTKALRRVLLAFSSRYPSIDFVQGLPFVAAHCLTSAFSFLHLRYTTEQFLGAATDETFARSPLVKEGLAFALLGRLLVEGMPSDFYTRQTPGLSREISILGESMATDIGMTSSSSSYSSSSTSSSSSSSGADALEGHDEGTEADHDDADSEEEESGRSRDDRKKKAREPETTASSNQLRRRLTRLPSAFPNSVARLLSSPVPQSSVPSGGLSQLLEHLGALCTGASSHGTKEDSTGTGSGSHSSGEIVGLFGSVLGLGAALEQAHSHPFHAAMAFVQGAVLPWFVCLYAFPSFPPAFTDRIWDRLLLAEGNICLLRTAMCLLRLALPSVLEAKDMQAAMDVLKTAAALSNSNNSSSGDKDKDKEGVQAQGPRRLLLDRESAHARRFFIEARRAILKDRAGAAPSSSGFQDQSAAWYESTPPLFRWQYFPALVMMQQQQQGERDRDRDRDRAGHSHNSAMAGGGASSPSPAASSRRPDNSSGGESSKSQRRLPVSSPSPSSSSSSSGAHSRQQRNISSPAAAPAPPPPSLWSSSSSSS